MQNTSHSFYMLTFSRCSEVFFVCLFLSFTIHANVGNLFLRHVIWAFVSAVISYHCFVHDSVFSSKIIPIAFILLFFSFFFPISATCQPDCLNGGICVNNKCKCSPGYSGPNCNIGKNNISH